MPRTTTKVSSLTHPHRHALQQTVIGFSRQTEAMVGSLKTMVQQAAELEAIVGLVPGLFPKDVIEAYQALPMDQRAYIDDFIRTMRQRSLDPHSPAVGVLANKLSKTASETPTSADLRRDRRRTRTRTVLMEEALDRSKAAAIMKQVDAAVAPADQTVPTGNANTTPVGSSSEPAAGSPST